EAEKRRGVKAVKIVDGVKPGTEIQWAGDELVAVAAVDEPTAEDAVRAIKVQYEVLPHLVIDTDPKVGDRAKPANEQTQGDADKGFKEAEVVVEGTYGLPVITHCCLESHGAITGAEGDGLLVNVSTQNVSGIASQMATPLGIPANTIHVHMDHVGGGFGSKFG